MYSKYSNKHRPQISAAFGGGGGGVNKRAALIHLKTVLSGITMVLISTLKSAPHFWRKKLISAAVLIRVNLVHFLMHCET